MIVVFLLLHPNMTEDEGPDRSKTIYLGTLLWNGALYVVWQTDRQTDRQTHKTHTLPPIPSDIRSIQSCSGSIFPPAIFWLSAAVFYGVWLDFYRLSSTMVVGRRRRHLSSHCHSLSTLHYCTANNGTKTTKCLALLCLA